MIRPIITRVVRRNDVSELLLSNWLRFAVVFLLQLVHHGNYTVETFGHTGPHPVLKERNAQSVVRFLLSTWFPAATVTETAQAAKRLFSHDLQAQNEIERYLPLWSTLFSCSKGQQEIAVWMAWYYSRSVWTVSILFLRSICLQMNPCFLHGVCANATICASLRPVSGRVYLGCFRHMVWI